MNEYALRMISVVENEYGKTIEELAAGLAHEVKNPLSLVKANIDLLELNDTDKRYEKSCRIMKRELERINDMLMDFIQLTKPVTAHIRRFQLAGLVLELVEQMCEVYGADIRFETEQIGEGFDIVGDDGKLRRMYLNVLKNAVEAVHSRIPADGERGLIRVELRALDGYVETIIEDNGAGIAPETVLRLAEPFFTTKTGGSGLGLQIVRGIAEEHGGSFEIGSADGGGCRARIMLRRGMDRE